MFPTASSEFPTLKILNIKRKNSEPTTHCNSAEMAKVHHKNTDKVSRRQGKAFLHDSCSLFRLLNMFANSHTNAYNYWVTSMAIPVGKWVGFVCSLFLNFIFRVGKSLACHSPGKWCLCA